MRNPPPTTPKQRKPNPSRKKACKACSDAKVRCGLEKPICSRCRAQGKTCRYFQNNVSGEGDQQQPSSQLRRSRRGTPYAAAGSAGTVTDESILHTASPSITTSATGGYIYDVSQTSDGSLLDTIYPGPPQNSRTTALTNVHHPQVQNDTDTQFMSTAAPVTMSGTFAPEITANLPQGQQHLQKHSYPTQPPYLNFQNVSLAPMVNAEEIRDHWMRSFFAPLTMSAGTDDAIMGEVQPQTKIYHPYTLQSVACVLRSYPDFMLSEDGVPPPIIHPLQVAKGQRIPESLANCFSLVRMWRKRAPGSEGLVVSVVKNEIQRLVGEQPPSDFECLCSFQAYLIYLMLAYFFPIPSGTGTGNNGAILCDDSAMITLQEIAFRTAKAGLKCREELTRQRPTWESWIVASAKRRTIFVMYIFVSLYNAHQGVPNFVADELKGVFVPESKKLWEATDRDTWEKEYSSYLSKWDDGMLEISELWKTEETGSERLRGRIARWLQGTDEFGMMLFMICAHIHGC